VPTWLAPNLITLAGFAFILLPHLVSVIAYGNETEGPVDGWFCVLTGVSFFVYNTLDNIDGKQARRTGTGSPMGMLFDHGLDATTCVVGNYPFLRMWQGGPGLPALVLVMMSTIMAYYLFLEEYYMGKLVLGQLSGPDDMGIFLSFCCFLTAYYGSEELWGRELEGVFGVEKMRLGQAVIYAIFAFNVAATLHQVVSNIHAGRSNATFQKRFKLPYFVAHISYMFVLILVYLGYTQLTGSTILVEAPKLTTLAYGGEFLQATLRTQVSNVSQETHMPYRRTTLASWSLLAVNAASLLATGEPLINELAMIVFICAMVWGSIAHYVYFVLQDFKRILGIEIFTIKPKVTTEESAKKK